MCYSGCRSALMRSACGRPRSSPLRPAYVGVAPPHLFLPTNSLRSGVPKDVDSLHSARSCRTLQAKNRKIPSKAEHLLLRIPRRPGRSRRSPSRKGVALTPPRHRKRPRPFCRLPNSTMQCRRPRISPRRYESPQISPRSTPAQAPLSIPTLPRHPLPVPSPLQRPLHPMSRLRKAMPRRPQLSSSTRPKATTRATLLVSPALKDLERQAHLV